MKNTRITTIILVLVISNIFFAWEYLSSKITIRNLETKVANQQVNDKILVFTQLFMDKILRGAKEVSFDDRLQLENAVRELNDKAIFNSWQTFTQAKNPTEIQNDFYNLFQLLLKKITV